MSPAQVRFLEPPLRLSHPHSAKPHKTPLRKPSRGQGRSLTRQTAAWKTPGRRSQGLPPDVLDNVDDDMSCETTASPESPSTNGVVSRNFEEGREAEDVGESGWGKDEGRMKSDWGTQSIDDGYVPLSQAAANARRKLGSRAKQGIDKDGREEDAYTSFENYKGFERDYRPSWTSVNEESKGNGNINSISRISMLKGDERSMILPFVPTGPQADYYAPKGVSENIAWWGATGAAVLLTSNYPPLVALAIGAGFTGSWVLAGLRNFEMTSKGSTFAGIWHAEILESELLDLGPQYFGSSGVTKTTNGQSMRMVIGDPWNGGVRVEMVLPYAFRMGAVQPCTQVELLVFSNDSKFSNFQVVREVYIPETRQWLSDYPFIDRDVFIRLSYNLQVGHSQKPSPWAW